jgi:hypothetical protein
MRQIGDHRNAVGELRRVVRIGLGAIALVATACTRAATVGSPAATPAPPPPPPPPDLPGERVIRDMYDMYGGRWYRTVTFVQKTTITPPTSAPIVQTWYEAASLPGKLRIDVEDPARGNGTLYRGDSAYSILNGRVSTARRDRNDLLILGFDVYLQPAATTIALLRERGFDLSKGYETTWRGKPVMVVGASRGDTTSRQFWVEKERQLFVRLVMPGARGRNDIRFDQYIRMSAGWIAIDVEQHVNGRLYLKEEYSDVRTNVTLDPALFLPETWRSARHWRGSRD